MVAPRPWSEVVEALEISVGDTFRVSFKQDGTVQGCALAVPSAEVVPTIRRVLLSLEQTGTEMGTLWQNDIVIVKYQELRPPARERFAISTDSGDYDMLARAVKMILHVPGMTCELGVRTGGGTKVILDALIENGDFDRHHVCIDPYGNLPFAWRGELWRPGYTNEMRQQALANLHEYVRSLPVTLHFFTLTDEDFFARFGTGIPFYTEDGRQLLNEYAFVHIDGPHATEPVLDEASFFAPRMRLGGVIVFDDWKEYDHDPVDSYLRNPGDDADPTFEVVEQGNSKIVYRRVR